MGNGVSRFAGSGTLKRLVNAANLPLEVDDDISHGQLQDPGKPPPLSAYTQAYDAKGFFTGVRSRVTIHKPAAVVYQSLSTNLHHVFTPMTVCDDTIEEDDGQGNQKIFRVIRIPFRVVFVSGNLKLRFHVEQSRKAGKVNFVNVKEGRLITKLLAEFDVTPCTGSNGEEATNVLLDAQIQAKQLPPPPFKGMVKGIMVSKIDQCMLDLMKFHGEGEQSETGSADEQEEVPTPSATITTSSQSPKADGSARTAAADRLSSHRPQSPVSESDNSADASMSQLPQQSQTHPLAQTPVLSNRPPLSGSADNDDRYL
ncbi:TPA: hypothetical protein ACH3X2_009264 [Trebouxia sp. C0005]